MRMSRTPMIAALLLLAAGPPSAAGPPATPASAKLPPAVAPVEKVEVAPAFGAVGATVDIEATLTAGGAPLSGRKVSFAVKGHGASVAAGAATTDAAGKARLAFKVPELAQESYELLGLAEPGPGRPAPAAGRAGFGVFKADVELRVREASRPHPKPSGGAVKSVSDGPWVETTLTRKTDGAEVSRNVRVLLDAKPYETRPSNSKVALPDLPDAAAIGVWNVGVIFDGDASYLAKTARITVPRK
jgi:hypothetical protein